MSQRHRTADGPQPAKQEKTADADQNKRPDSPPAEIPYVERVQEEDDAQADEDQSSDWNLAYVHAVARCKTGTESCSQSEWIGRGLPQLYGPSRAHAVDNLVKVKSCDSQAEDSAHGFAAAARSQHQQSEDHQMRQALGVLAAVNCAYAERKEASEDSCQSRIWTSAG